LNGPRSDRVCSAIYDQLRHRLAGRWGIENAPDAAIIIELGREIFANRKVSSATFARALA
jgi:hypothetical protein